MRWPTGLSLPCARGAVEEMTPSGISVPLRPGGEVGEVGALALPPGPGSVLPSARTTRDARLKATAPDDPKMPTQISLPFFIKENERPKRVESPEFVRCTHVLFAVVSTDVEGNVNRHHAQANLHTINNGIGCSSYHFRIARCLVPASGSKQPTLLEHLRHLQCWCCTNSSLTTPLLNLRCSTSGENEETECTSAVNDKKVNAWGEVRMLEVMVMFGNWGRVGDLI